MALSRRFLPFTPPPSFFPFMNVCSVNTLTSFGRLLFSRGVAPHMRSFSETLLDLPTLRFFRGSHPPLFCLLIPSYPEIATGEFPFWTIPPISTLFGFVKFFFRIPPPHYIRELRGFSIVMVSSNVGFEFPLELFVPLQSNHGLCSCNLRSMKSRVP